MEILLIIVLLLVYFLPSIVASGTRLSATVFVINLFFGWTLIGWVIALAMAVMKD